MKAKIEGGYLYLQNDAGQDLYCIHRKPITALVPDNFQRPQGIEMLTTASRCGDHCPFFDLGPDKIATIRCAFQEIHVGITEIDGQVETQSKLNLLP